ncbi:MAG TPA: family 43 glycosylhydrolase [Dinghuibacter sp.]|uniref:family 43 glycosylhydrolase n=1 Tax=Dinghuibacter sp. TaxID=2024697 RepID=UPI002BC34260|nr:family 43 glycosylhydrolase [Dinghuibacter sp.]HTJ12323.1 family 43 glycosylhydrolase [Dinghuibacter sp.]
MRKLLALLLVVSMHADAQNPIFQGWYADPETAVYGGTYWVYPTYSARYRDQTFFDAFSSTDLVHWTKHHDILDTAGVKWAKRAMWAPAIAEKDGKYYFFFGANDIQNDSAVGGIGVAVADKPGGPYRDYLGKPLIGAFHNGAQPIDQAVFQDKDGAWYMIYGGWRHCNIARLKDDFTGFIPFPDGSTFKEITPEGYVEGPYMIYRNGKYYFMWSEGGWTGPDYSVAYAMADKPTGPFKRIGKILQQDMAVATGAGHHSVLHIPGTDDYYIVYHRRPLDETDANHREVCIDTMAFGADGRILPVKITRSGVHARPAGPSAGLTGPAAEKPKPPASVQQFIAYDQPVLAFTHCNLADVEGLQVRRDQTVVVRNGVIAAIGGDIPADATVIDCTGKSLLPGYVLMHEHMYYPDISPNPAYIHYKQLPFTFPKLYLACGATTIRTAGSVEPYSDLNLKRDIDAGKIVGPNMDVTAPYIEGVGAFAPQMHECKGPQDAKAFVNFWADQGCTSFKAYNVLDRPTLKAAIDAAHARGLKITGHLCSVTYHEAAEMGIDQLEHGFLAATDFIPGKKEDACMNAANPLATADSTGATALIRYMVSRKVILTSTLAVFEGMSTADSLPHPDVLSAMSPDTRDLFEKSLTRHRSPAYNGAMARDMQLERQFADAGGLLTVGTDPTGNGAVLAGYGSLRAIELLTGEGWTPIEAIRIATLNGAQALGLQSRIGSIAVGKTADLIVIDGDITHDIHAIRNVRWVFKAGVGYDSKKLFDLVQGHVGQY